MDGGYARKIGVSALITPVPTVSPSFPHRIRPGCRVCWVQLVLVKMCPLRGMIDVFRLLCDMLHLTQDQHAEITKLP